MFRIKKSFYLVLFSFCIFAFFSVKLYSEKNIQNSSYPRDDIKALLSQTFPVSSFKSVVVEDAIECSLIPSNKDSVWVIASSEIMPYMKIEVEKYRLKIGINSLPRRLQKMESRVKVYVMFRELHSILATDAALKLKGTYKGNGKLGLGIKVQDAASLEGGFKNLAFLNLEAIDASSVHIKIDNTTAISFQASNASSISSEINQVSDFLLKLNEASTINCIGQVNRTNMNLTEASRLSAKKLYTHSLKANLDEASSAFISVLENTECRVREAASLYIYGPVKGKRKINKSPGSSVKFLND